jgi:osmotically-inducible protein OsmY
VDLIRSLQSSESGLPVRENLSVAMVTDTNEVPQALLQRVDMAIKGNPHLAGHQVFCQEESGIVVLHGRVGTFFQKQMAQETLKRLEGVEKVINELQVDWFTSISPR